MKTRQETKTSMRGASALARKLVRTGKVTSKKELDAILIKRFPVLEGDDIGLKSRWNMAKRIAAHSQN